MTYIRGARGWLRGLTGSSSRDAKIGAGDFEITFQSFIFGAILNNFSLSHDACARDGKFLEKNLDWISILL